MRLWGSLTLFAGAPNVRDELIAELAVLLEIT